MKPRYSAKEIELFKKLNFDMWDHVQPIVTYRMAVEHCFMEEISDERANSVRRCMLAMQEGYPFRLTKEFDELISY